MSPPVKDTEPTLEAIPSLCMQMHHTPVDVVKYLVTEDAVITDVRRIVYSKFEPQQHRVRPCVFSLGWA